MAMCFGAVPVMVSASGSGMARARAHMGRARAHMGRAMQLGGGMVLAMRLGRED